MKPLDFVKTKAGNIGIITEVQGGLGEESASISFLNSFNTHYEEKTAWWKKNELEVIDNLPDILSRNLKHPFGTGSLQPFKQL